MNLFQAIFLGIVQGITEWLPISSSGHLALFQKWFQINPPLFFDILLHFGTLIVIFIVFAKDIWQIFKDLFTFNFKSESGKLSLMIICASVPAVLAGLLAKKVFIFAFQNLLMVSTGLLLTSILLFLSKKRIFKTDKTQNKLNIKNTFIIGIFQALALFPGVSRSGSTISAGLFFGIEPKKAARFSFLLVIPAILGATILDFDWQGINENLSIYLAGFLSSLVAGYISLKFLLKTIEKGKFHYFAYYCLILSLIVLIINFI